jgi:hypothetical protein
MLNLGYFITILITYTVYWGPQAFKCPPPTERIPLYAYVYSWTWNLFAVDLAMKLNLAIDIDTIVSTTQGKQFLVPEWLNCLLQYVSILCLVASTTLVENVFS